MSWVAGIDYSTRAVDIVWIDDDGAEQPIWRRFDLVGADAFERTRVVRAAMPSASTWDDTLAIGIEHPGGRHGVHQLLRVQGAIISCLPAGVLVQPWPPSQWKKAVGLKGNATKSEVESFVHLHTFANESQDTFDFVLDEWTQDALDAYCIALTTRAALVKEKAA